MNDIENELKNLVLEYHSAIHYSEYLKQNMTDIKIALDAWLKEEEIRKKIFAKIDELVSALQAASQ